MLPALQTGIYKPHLYKHSIASDFTPALSVTKSQMKETEWKCYPIVVLLHECLHPIVSPIVSDGLLSSLPHYLLLSFVLLNKNSVGTAQACSLPTWQREQEGTYHSPGPSGHDSTKT